MKTCMYGLLEEYGGQMIPKICDERCVGYKSRSQITESLLICFRQISKSVY